jgi:hypothetical protein
LIGDELDLTSGPAVQPKTSKQQRKRFLVVYGLLGLVLGAAVAGLVILLVKPGQSPETVWSSWKPEGDESTLTQEIADHVARSYLLPSGQQLVGVQAAPLRIQDVPIGAIAIRRAPPAGSVQIPVDIFESTDSVVYIMCGFGESCSIPEGTPSPERLRLLRREALELALYTFHYVDDKDSVVAFLPPAPGDEATLALFFRRGEFEPELDKPLRLTLPAATPPLPEQIAPGEVATIDRLTVATMFRYEFQQLQDGTAVLVLNDPSLPVPEETQGSTESGSTSPATTQ